MLACIGLFVTLTMWDDYNSKPSGQSLVNPCLITRMSDRKATYVPRATCMVYAPGHYLNSQQVAETCDQVKEKISALKIKE